MSIEIDFLSVIYLVGATQGLFLTAALATKDIGSHAANRYLSLFLFIFSLSLIDEFFYQSHYFYEFPHLIGLIWPLDFLYGPLFYFYLRILTAKNESELSPNKVKHFALAGPGFCLAIPFWVLDGNQKLAFLYNLESEIIQLPAAALLCDILASLLAILQMLVYLVLGFGHLKRHQLDVEHRFSNLEKVNLAWLRTLLIMLVFLWLFYLFDIFFSELVGLGDSLGILLHLCLVVIFYVMGYRGLKQGSIFQQSSQAVAPQSTKYATSGLSREASQDIAHSIQQYLRQEKPYLKNDLNLMELAEMVEVSSHHLSQVINEQLGKNFFDFINQYRVKEAEAMILNNESKMAVIDIAMAAGFNSKTAFYQAFKKQTGMTPTQFRNNHLTCQVVEHS